MSPQMRSTASEDPTLKDKHLPPILQLLQKHIRLTVHEQAEGWKHCPGLRSQQEHSHVSSVRSSASISQRELGGGK